MSEPYVALTAYSVPIPKALPDRRAALEWARTTGPKFPGCRIAQVTARGLRTIWKHEPQAVTA